ncbi:MAG: hypothetical protein V1859_08910 [archaeon]
MQTKKALPKKKISAKKPVVVSKNLKKAAPTKTVKKIVKKAAPKKKIERVIKKVAKIKVLPKKKEKPLVAAKKQKEAEVEEDEPKKVDKRVTNKMIEEVVIEFVGEEALPIVFYLKDKEKTSEFVIAKSVKKDIHEARALLYKLFENNLAAFIRKKDKIKGWYICYWDFTQDKIFYLYQKLKYIKVRELKQRLEREKANEFYMCRNACARVDFDKAFEINFKCLECGELLNPLDNKRTMEFLTQRISELETEIKANREKKE